MRQHTRHRWFACSLAALVLWANALPVGSLGCNRAKGSVAPGKTCCGRCQQAGEAPGSCCQPRPSCCAKSHAAKKAASPQQEAASKCCCHRGSEAPVVPAPVPENGASQVKHILAAEDSSATHQVLPTRPADAAPRDLLSSDEQVPPVRVRYCIWLI